MIIIENNEITHFFDLIIVRFIVLINMKNAIFFLTLHF